MSRKILVLDTSVLLYDMTAIHSFPGNDVVIPLTVLDELDRFKDKPGLLGESARYVNRYMDDLRSIDSLDNEVKIPDSDQTLRVEIDIEKDKAKIPFPLNHQYADNLILATALRLKQKSKKKLKVITKDINLRVKCDAIGLIAEDYYRDHIDVDQKTDPFSQLLLEILTSMSSFEKSLIDMRRSEGIERTKTLEPSQINAAQTGKAAELGSRGTVMFCGLSSGWP